MVCEQFASPVVLDSHDPKTLDHSCEPKRPSPPLTVRCPPREGLHEPQHKTLDVILVRGLHALGSLTYLPWMYSLSEDMDWIKGVRQVETDLCTP